MTKISEAEKAWKALLAPMANDYSAMVDGVIRLCKGLTDEGLAELISATYQPTETNCWWATYGAAQIVRQEAESERYLRAQIAAGAPIGAGLSVLEVR